MTRVSKEQRKLGRSLPDERFIREDKILLVRTRNLSIKQDSCEDHCDKKYNLNRLSNIFARKEYNLKGLQCL
jgi:hypothetical protein